MIKTLAWKLERVVSGVLPSLMKKHYMYTMKSFTYFEELPPVINKAGYSKNPPYYWLSKFTLLIIDALRAIYYACLSVMYGTDWGK